MKPMLFNTEEVRATLDARKTVTRRVVKKSTVDKFVLSQDGRLLGNFNADYPEWGTYPTIDDAPYCPGDILYVRETFFECRGHFYYKADGKHEALPGWACTSSGSPPSMCNDYTSTALGFFDVWDSTIKPKDRDLYGWAANPWVWVIEFERCEKPEDAQNEID